MSSNLMIVALVAMATMAVLTFWRKVLVLLLSVGIAVFFYGLVDLMRAMSLL